MSPCRLVLVLVAAAAATACTPLRSKLPPPYILDDREFTAQELQSYATEACAFAVAHTKDIVMPSLPVPTDGCSAGPESRVQSCCLKHDVAYWCGAVQRREADQAFRACVRDASSPANANVMYSGVRLGGGRFMPFPWRFGYGHAWPHRKPAAAPSNNVTSSESSPQTPLTGR